MKEPIAYVIYTPYGDFSYKALNTLEEIERVRNGEDEDVRDWQNFIVLGSYLRLEDHS